MDTPHRAQDLLEALTERLAARADPPRAAQMRAYQRDQFDFLGVPAPARRALVKACSPRVLEEPALLALADALWALPQREYQYAAIDLLDLHRRRLAFEAVPALLALARRKPWWDSVDGLAGVLGRLLRAAGKEAADVHAPMDAALADASFWIRRIAMTHQLGWRLETDRARLFGYALALADEREFFIRKAIGWALRDYARWAPDAVAAFLAAQRERFSPLTLREAGKHL